MVRSRRGPPESWTSKLLERVSALRRYLAAGGPVSAADLTKPWDVERGEIVTVEVQSGGAVLVLEAEAQASGRQGQSIALRNSTSGKMFRAKITGKGRALLECRPEELEK